MVLLFFQGSHFLALTGGNMLPVSGANEPLKKVDFHHSAKANGGFSADTQIIGRGLC